MLARFNRKADTIDDRDVGPSRISKCYISELERPFERSIREHLRLLRVLNERLPKKLLLKLSVRCDSAGENMQKGCDLTH
jgi:hypothetical protein